MYVHTDRRTHTYVLFNARMFGHDIYQPTNLHGQLYNMAKKGGNIKFAFISKGKKSGEKMTGKYVPSSSRNARTYDHLRNIYIQQLNSQLAIAIYASDI